MKINKITKITLEGDKQYYDVVNAYPYNNFLIKTKSGAVCSHNCFFDEISFIKNKDVDEQKKKALDMIDTAIGGMKTRFIYNGKNPTMLVVSSSKRSEQSFMETYIRTLSETQSENTLIVDKPVWEVKPKGTYSDKTFYVGLGNKYLSSIVIPDKDRNNLQQYIDKGYELIEVPIDFKAKALENLERTLCDYAGISSFATNKFLSAERVLDIVDEKISNPMPDVIKVGNGKDDKSQYSDFFDFSKLDKQLMTKPLFIHLDMSVSGDKTGIAGVWIIGKKPTSDGNPGKDLFYQLAFSTSVEAPKGWQISFEKNRQFIRWLKEQGFNIREITSDTYQSYDLQQQLKSEGFNCSILSVDRVETAAGEKVGVCRPYQYLQNTIYEKRIKLYKTELLYNELVQLEKNNTNGKIDHPDGGRRGCFTGDTKVSLVDGRNLTFLELVDEFNKGKKNYVYSMNLETHKIEPRLIENAWCTRKNAELVKVTLDNGEVLRCTPDHKFMLRNGEYCEAKDLQANDSLMPLYTKLADKGLYINSAKALAEHNKQSSMLKKLFPEIDENKFKELFGFKYSDLPSSQKGPYSIRYRQKLYELVNHKVISVEFIEDKEDVYDITVEHNHNFALASGVFVHNSKDQADAVCGALFTASKYAEEFAYSFGETWDDVIIANKEEYTQMMVDFEQELKERNIKATTVLTKFKDDELNDDSSNYDFFII